MKSPREQAIIELIAQFKRFDFNTQDDFIREMFRRMRDMDILALYYEVFGHPVGERPKAVLG